MAILAKIREKTIFLILIIGLALFAFVISGVLGKGNSGPSRDNVGSINGDEISREIFSNLVEAQRGRNRNTGSTLQAVNAVWDNVIRTKIYEAQLEKAGIVIGEKNIWDAVVQNPSFQNNPNFKNEAGLFDEAKLKEYLATLRDNQNTKEGKNLWLNWVYSENQIQNSLKQNTYNNLVNAGLNATLKEGEQSYLSNNENTDVEYIFEPYSSIKDTLVSISDKEYLDYMAKHKKEFEVEASRDVEFVNFKVVPSSDDIASVKTEIIELLNDHEVENKITGSKETEKGFKNTTDDLAFVNMFSDTAYDNKLFLEKDFQKNIFDSISKLQKGEIYGPYKDGNYFKLVKMISKEGEESKKPSHLLIAYVGATRASEKVTRTKEEAKTFAESLLKKVNRGNDFVELVKENSDGPTASKGGDLGWVKENVNFVKEFKDFIFSHKKGDVSLVETEFGFHIIKIDDEKIDPGFKLAIVSKKIDPSEKTVNSFFKKAETLFSEITKGQKLEDLAKSNNYNVVKSNNLLELSEKISLLGDQRSIVRWAFENETNVGDAKRFELNNGDYVVVVVKQKNKKGLASLNTVKNKIKPILINQKKAQLIREKLKGNSLEDIAKAINKKTNKSLSVSLSSPVFTTGGRDKNVIGALMYMNEGDFNIIDGQTGVFAIKVLKKHSAQELKVFNIYSNKITKELRNRKIQIYNALKESSEIEDRRATIY
jgi:parvulin-like peptidyl-prolyl isomerase